LPRGEAGILTAVPLAHLGHWYLWIPYAIPVVVVLAASIHALRQQRREDRERDQTEKPAP
jgi:heme exporter protein D